MDIHVVVPIRRSWELCRDWQESLSSLAGYIHISVIVGTTLGPDSWHSCQFAILGIHGICTSTLAAVFRKTFEPRNTHDPCCSLQKKHLNPEIHMIHAALTFSCSMYVVLCAHHCHHQALPSGQLHCHLDNYIVIWTIALPCSHNFLCWELCVLVVHVGHKFCTLLNTVTGNPCCDCLSLSV